MIVYVSIKQYSLCIYFNTLYYNAEGEREMDSLLLFKCESCETHCSTVSKDKKHVVCCRSCEDKVMAKKALSLDAARLLPDSSLSSVTGTEDKQLLAVRGHGEIKVTSDRLQITLVVIRKDKEIAVVNERLIKGADAILDLLKNKSEGKADKIQTENMRIDPIYAPQPRDRSYDERERVILGYEGVFPISFESTVKEAGPIIEKALKTNIADNVRDMNYIVSDEIAKPAYEEALRRASLNAIEQADIVLSTLNMKRLNIRSINIENTGARPVPRFSSEESYGSYKQKSLLSAAKKSMEFLAPENTISAFVSLTLSYV